MGFAVRALFETEAAAAMRADLWEEAGLCLLAETAVRLVLPDGAG